MTFYIAPFICGQIVCFPIVEVVHSVKCFPGSYILEVSADAAEEHKCLHAAWYPTWRHCTLFGRIKRQTLLDP